MANGTTPGPISVFGKPMTLDAGTLALTENTPPGVVGLDSGGAQPSGTLGQSVLQKTQALLGQKVGDGECFALADKALRSAGAKSAGDFKPVVPNDDYQWGATASTADLRPGDLIQFRDFEIKKTVTVTKPDGSETSDSTTELRDHHTAIVEAVGADGTVTVLEQNMPPGGPTRRARIRLTDQTSQSGGTTTTFEVSGQTWLYHPVPK